MKLPKRSMDPTVAAALIVGASGVLVEVLKIVAGG
jgi:hypothetical protein